MLALSKSVFTVRRQGNFSCAMQKRLNLLPLLIFVATASIHGSHQVAVQLSESVTPQQEA